MDQVFRWLSQLSGQDPQALIKQGIWVRDLHQQSGSDRQGGVSLRAACGCELSGRPKPGVSPWAASSGENKNICPDHSTVGQKVFEKLSSNSLVGAEVINEKGFCEYKVYIGLLLDIIPHAKPTGVGKTLRFFRKFLEFILKILQFSENFLEFSEKN